MFMPIVCLCAPPIVAAGHYAYNNNSCVTRKLSHSCVSSAYMASRFLFVLRPIRLNAYTRMTNNLTLFEHPQFGNVRVKMDASNEPIFCLRDLCEALGLNPSHVKERLDDGVVSTDTISDSLGRTQYVNFVNESGMYDVVLDSRKKSARVFRKWITDEVLPSIRKTGKYELPKQEVAPVDEKKITKENVESRILLTEAYTRLLNINDTSKAMMLNSIAQDLGHPLLDYVPSKGVMHSVTYLLKANGVEMSAQKFNKILAEKGFLEVMTRPTRGGEKHFYNIPDRWKEYGENQTSPQNPKETQPNWYDNKFHELLNLIK